MDAASLSIAFSETPFGKIAPELRNQIARLVLARDNPMRFFCQVEPYSEDHYEWDLYQERRGQYGGDERGWLEFGNLFYTSYKKDADGRVFQTRTNVNDRWGDRKRTYEIKEPRRKVKDVYLTSTWDVCEAQPIAISFTCKQLLAETKSLFFAENTFILDPAGVYRFDTHRILDTFTSMAGLPAMAAIRDIEIVTQLRTTCMSFHGTSDVKKCDTCKYTKATIVYLSKWMQQHPNVNIRFRLFYNSRYHTISWHFDKTGLHRSLLEEHTSDDRSDNKLAKECADVFEKWMVGASEAKGWCLEL